MKVKVKYIEMNTFLNRVCVKAIIKEVENIKMFRGFKELSEEDYIYFKWRISLLKLDELQKLEALRQLHKLFKKEVQE